MKRLVCVSALSWLCASPVFAGISYSLLENQAAPGEQVTIQAVLFNDEQNELNWAPPEQIVLQWRDGQGNATRSLATLVGQDQPVIVPVNNFVVFNWTAAVPTAVKGIQVINVEGSADMFALDTSGLDPSLIASTSAEVPIVDAGAAKPGDLVDPVLPEDQVLRAGLSADAGPAPNTARPMTVSATAFDAFRSSISAHDPIYFIFGNKPDSNARFQLSFKYRLFSPKDAKAPRFWENFYFGYTQTSLWDIHGESSPFVDTTYNPSLFWRSGALWNPQDSPVHVGLMAGVEHKSNGKDDEESRSLNDYFVQPEFNYRFTNGSTLQFAPRLKAYFATSDNPDYKDYFGHVDWKLSWRQDHGLSVAALYKRGRHGRDAKQVELAWPLKRTPLNMNGYFFVQYYQGYGETLLNYRTKVGPHVRMGLALTP